MGDPLVHFWRILVPSEFGIFLVEFNMGNLYARKVPRSTKFVILNMFSIFTKNVFVPLKIYARGVHFAYTYVRMYKMWRLAGSVVSR